VREFHMRSAMSPPVRGDGELYEHRRLRGAAKPVGGPRGVERVVFLSSPAYAHMPSGGVEN